MRILCIILASLLTIGLLSGCSDRNAESILPTDVQLMAGDVVLRRGNGVTSHIVMMAEKDGNYSHVGIVTDSAGVMMICHAVPGEPDFEGDEDRVKLESSEKFFNELNAERGCLLRHNDRQTAHRAAEIAMELYRRGTLFDHDYNEEDTTSMYCCELVEYAYLRAGESLVGEKRHYFNAPGLHFERLMLPSDFLKSDKLELVREF